MIRGAITNHISGLLTWGAERIRLQNADSLVDRCNQWDAKMGFGICSV